MPDLMRVLVATEPEMAPAIARGIEAAGVEAELCPAQPAAVDARMRAVFALVVGEPVLDRGSLEGRVSGELAVRARQAGVPCHAIVGADRLDAFDKRILDLQHVLEAGDEAGLEAAGRELAERLVAETLPSIR
jgi:glycerate kinase